LRGRFRGACVYLAYLPETKTGPVLQSQFSADLGSATTLRAGQLR
jgi:hypothetical protein